MFEKGQQYFFYKNYIKFQTAYRALAKQRKSTDKNN
jgi:hypothetical protein